MFSFIIVSLQVKANTIPTAHDMEKVQMTIKAISRDWSADGEKERELCYQPILDELARWFPLSEYIFFLFYITFGELI